MTVETKLDKLLDIQSAITLYDEAAGMLYEIALVEPDDTVTNVVCKIAEWLSNRSDVPSDKSDRIYEKLSRLKQSEDYSDEECSYMDLDEIRGQNGEE